jgi:hypothetical protein
MSDNKRTSKQWQDALEDGDTVTNYDSNKPCVLLRALQRLSQEAGIIESGPITLQHVTQGDYGIFQCVYEVKFDDGTTWRAAADCNKNSVDGKFANYPTAIAESRAEARALKKALGITMLAAEEIDLSASSEVTPTQKITSNIIAAIQSLIESNELDTLGVLEKVLPDRADSLNGLSDLTVAEGQSVMAHLNNLPKKKTAAKKTSSRASKKEAAEAVLKDK